ncbi:MAG: DUF3604 domain-containing protein [Promethearchaeota archaeon]
MKSKFRILGIPEVLKDKKSKKSVRIIVLISIFSVGFFFWSLDPVNFNWRPLIKNNPAVLRVFAPSIVKAGESVEFTVECWDYVERLSCGYDGTVEFYSLREKPGSNGTLIEVNVDFSVDKYKFKPSWFYQGFIEAYRFPWGDGGIKKFKVIFNEPGIHYIIARDRSNKMIAYSNPIVVYENDPEVFLYWGDIHGHSSKCDGSGDIDTLLYYAKNIACLDFASITTHDHFINALISPIGWSINWEHTKWRIEEWNKKNDFVTIQAYEWRGNFLASGNSIGDRVIYSRTSEIPYFSGADKNYRNDRLLNKALKEWMSEKSGRKVMTIAHHPPHTLMGMKTDWSYFDPKMSRLVEIYSVHGSSEMSKDQGNEYYIVGGSKKPIRMETDEPGYHIRDALSMGYHIGFIASGDSHDGHIGHSLSHTEARHLWQPPLSYTAFPNHMFRCHHYRPNGLVGVFSPELSREAIFDSLWNRACYAIKGISRPYVNFSINGTSVGVHNSILEVNNENATRLIRIDVAAGGGDDNYLKKIEIIRNNKVWKSIDLSRDKKRIYHGYFLDNDKIIGTSYWEYRDLNPEDYKKDGKYYINDEADNGVDSPEDLSTHGEMFYYLKVYTDGSAYYNRIFNYYNRELLPRGEDIAWVGPIWIKIKI